MIKPYYSEPGIEIWNNECLSILPQLPPVDMVLTSPPFKDEDVPRDYYQWIAVVIDALTDKSKSVVMFNSSTRLVELCKYTHPKRGLIWDKVRTESAYRYEPIFIYGNGRPSIWNDCLRCLPVVGSEQITPYQNPVTLYSQLLRYFKPSTVLDPFMGSGTTIIAAKQLGISAIGIEIDPYRCDAAIDRLRQEVLPLNQPESAIMEQEPLL